MKPCYRIKVEKVTKPMKESHQSPTSNQPEHGCYLTDADMKLFEDRFYWRHDELFQKIRQEEEAIRQAVEALDKKSKDTYVIEGIERLQVRMNRMQTVQKKLNDRHLDDFKEMIYPGAKFVPALALFGVGGMAIVLGPSFALLFAGGFLASNVLVKGKRSVLNVHFGIATTIQATAVTLGVLSLAGVAVVNPMVVTGLVVVGGAWLFTAAVFRGGMRQKEARDVKLAGIERSVNRFFSKLVEIKDMVRGLTDDAMMQGKLCEYVDSMLQSQMWQESVKITSEQIQEKFGIDQNKSEALLVQIMALKIDYDSLNYDLNDYENLLRTVKNPFEKSKRIQDIRKIEQSAQTKGLDDFPHVSKDALLKVKETGDDIEFVFKKDVPWIVSNITLLTIAGLSIPLVGMLLLGSPILMTPPVLIAIGTIAMTVALVYVGCHLREKHLEKKRAARDLEKQELHERLDIGHIEDPELSKSDSLKKKTGHTPMLLDKNEMKKFKQKHKLRKLGAQHEADEEEHHAKHKKDQGQ